MASCACGCEISGFNYNGVVVDIGLYYVRFESAALLERCWVSIVSKATYWIMDERTMEVPVCFDRNSSVLNRDYSVMGF